jgi:hypothetical protein
MCGYIRHENEKKSIPGPNKQLFLKRFPYRMVTSHSFKYFSGFYGYFRD